MKFFKYSILLCLAFLLCFSFSTTVFGATQVTSSTVKEYSNNTNINGSLPSVTTNSDSLAKAVNNEITNIYTKRSNTAKTSNAKSITFSYEVYESGNYTSIVIYSKVSKLKTVTSVDTIVFDNSKIYTLDNYLSSADLKVFNKSINDKIKQSPGNYKVSDVTLNDKTAFYIKNGTVFVCFDGESISTSTEVLTFSYTQTSYDKYTLNKDDYFIQSSSQLKYVPIRDVYTNLGYKVSYRNKLIYITDSNGKTITTFDTDDSSSSVKNKALVSNGISYAPLSVIQNTTNVIYDIQSNGDIVFPLVD